MFHVLAHVDVPFAASCFAPLYCAWISSLFGPAVDRTLAEDARVLAEAATSHDVFARAQAVAWVFDSADSARRAMDAELSEVAGDDEAALSIARSAGPIAEVLRAAAELELPLLEALAPLTFDQAEIDAAVTRVLPVAPALADHTIALLPALGLRGRVHGRTIFTGMPGIAGCTAEHIAWQAAHEATVSEGAGGYLDVERRALGLFRSRARRAGLTAEHARWLAHLDLSAIGAIPDVEDATE